MKTCRCTCASCVFPSCSFDQYTESRSSQRQSPKRVVASVQRMLTMSYSSHAWKLAMMIMMLGAAASMKMPIAVVRTFSVFPPSQSMKPK
eukprot:1249641-Rhodomonas_salina.1